MDCKAEIEDRREALVEEYFQRLEDIKDKQKQLVQDHLALNRWYDEELGKLMHDYNILLYGREHADWIRSLVGPNSNE